MRKSSKKPALPSQRMNEYRARLREAGLRPVQLWLPDTRAASFAKTCRKQAKAIAASDRAGEELDTFISSSFEWPAP